MKPKVYVETTIVSYLVARRTRNVIVGAHQELTRRWWRQRGRFEIFASPLVIEEASRGDAAARRRRIRLLRDLTLLEVNDDSRIVGGGSWRRGRYRHKPKAMPCTLRSRRFTGWSTW